MSVYIYRIIDDVLLQCYSDVSSSEKRINNLVKFNLIYKYIMFLNPSLTFYFKMFNYQRLG